jgi:hypothetical protein
MNPFDEGESNQLIPLAEGLTSYPWSRMQSDSASFPKLHLILPVTSILLAHACSGAHPK